MSTKVTTYDESKIKTLEGLDGIRTRPTMYIGFTGIAGNCHLTREASDNSFDEVNNGHGDKVVLTFTKDKYMQTEDFGRGIPFGSIEDAFMKMHTSGKFDNGEYATSAGMNGVGLKAINALSVHTYCEVIRDGQMAVMEFSKGKILKPLKITKIPSNITKTSGTLVRFFPDKDIMQTSEFDLDIIKENLDTVCYLNSKIKVDFIDENNKENNKSFHHPNGILDLLTKMTKGKDLLKNKFVIPKIEEKFKVKDIEGKEIEHKMSFELALAYTNSSEEDYNSFANTVNTKEGGTHETGIKLGVVAAIKQYMSDNETLTTAKEKKLTLVGEDYRQGIKCIISLLHSNIQFVGQTKQKVGNTEVQGFVSRIMKEKMVDWLNSHPEDAKKLVRLVIMNANKRIASKKAKENIDKKGDTALSIMSDLGKLNDCELKGIGTEIFLTEGK